MIIEENQLRPPSPKEMQARYVPLERIRIEWQPQCWDWDWFTMTVSVDDHYRGGTCDCPETCGTTDTLDTGFTTLELIEFHKDWAIPYEAYLVNDGYEGEKALDWTHLRKCETCNQWFLPDTDHTTTDALHLAKVREITKLFTGEGKEDDTEAKA
jgi:hypothetical protein